MPERLKRVYAFQCPHCGREIKYNRNYYDKKIAELKASITSIHAQLTEHKDDGDPEWKKRCVAAKGALEQQLAEIKSFRAEANVLIKERIDSAFKGVVKEKIGEENYRKWMQEAEQRIEYADTKELMRHGEGGG